MSGAPTDYGPTTAPGASHVSRTFEDRRREYERHALTYPQPDRTRTVVTEQALHQVCHARAGPGPGPMRTQAGFIDINNQDAAVNFAAGNGLAQRVLDQMLDLENKRRRRRQPLQRRRQQGYRAQPSPAKQRRGRLHGDVRPGLKPSPVTCARTQRLTRQTARSGHAGRGKQPRRGSCHRPAPE